MEDWLEAGSGSGAMWDESSGPVQGKYIKRRSDVGPNNSMVYTIRLDSGEELGIWGSTVIDTKFKEILPGSMVRIEFMGKVAGKRGGSQYKDYKILYKPDPSAPAAPVADPDDSRAVEDDRVPTGDDVVPTDIGGDDGKINLSDIPF